MRAAVIHRYGGPEVLAIEDVAPPRPGPRDLLVDVRAASLNPIDYKFRERMVWPLLRPRLPIVLGCDIAGVVRELGPEVRGLAVGDEVFARLEKPRMGGLAEQVAADASVLAKKPATMDFAQAASVPLAGLTALQALRDTAKLEPGQRVLIHAGAGGVGTLAIQIAKILGLVVVTTTSAKNRELVESLGADEVIDYQKQDVAAKARDLDAVFDTLGDASELRSLAMVKRGGVVVGVSGMPEPDFPMLPWFARPVVWLRTRARRAAVARTGARFAYLFMRPDAAELAELAAWADAGKLRAVIHRAYPSRRGEGRVRRARSWPRSWQDRGHDRLTSMRYEGRIYRPPSEADAYILQATIGCSWNHCTYCDMYRDKQFRVRALDETLADLDEAGRRIGGRVEKLFVADGDALVMELDRLAADPRLGRASGCRD